MTSFAYRIPESISSGIEKFRWKKRQWKAVQSGDLKTAQDQVFGAADGSVPDITSQYKSDKTR